MIDVIASDFYAEAELGDQYRAWGAVRCAAPAAPVEHDGEAIYLDELTFLVTLSWVP